MKYRVFKKKSLQKQHSNLFLSGAPPWESPEGEGGTTGGGSERERPPPGPPAPARPPPPPRPCPTETEDRDT